jgi:sialate O-acetylesterase
VSKGGPLKTFEICGEDGEYFPGEATIEGDTILVRSTYVSAPTAVRYAWANYPEGCNLYNAAGLPAAPFRTDKR